MAILEIKVVGCPVLRRRAEPVEAVTDEVRTLVKDMFETMYAAEGIGLAAPQVGVGLRVVVLDVRPRDATAEPTVLINPTQLQADEEVLGEEGCLSLPGIVGEVKRPSTVLLESLGVDGARFQLELTGIAARAALHEMDHLDGVLLTDHLGTIKRNLLRKQLRVLRREGKRQSSERKRAVELPVDADLRAGVG
jgi:peptide deformylase